MDVPHPALPALPLPADTRVGERERALACDQLSAHYAAGRLGPDELEVRLDAAMTAPTVGALRVLLRDLPDPGPRAPRPASPPRVGPGALDLLALACVVGALGIAVLTVLSLVATGAGWVLAAGLVDGTVAAAGGGGAVHLAHRSWRRSVEHAAQDQRPRIA